MATFQAHANLAWSTVVTPPSPATSGTTLTVTAGQGALFPVTPFNALVAPANTVPTTLNAEIVTVTNVTGDTLTITRAQESTTAQAIAAGYVIADAITAKTITDIETAIPTAANPTASVGTTAVNGSATTFMRSDAAPAVNLAMNPTWTGTHTISKSIGATNTIGLLLQNPLTGVSDYYSPMLGFESNNGLSTSAHKYIAFQLQPGSANQFGSGNQLVMLTSANGTTWTENGFVIDDMGNLITASILYGLIQATGLQIQGSTNANLINFILDDVDLVLGNQCTIRPTVNNALLQFGIGTVNTAPVAVASLPAGADGDRAFVNNSNVVAAGNFGNAVAAGGTNHVPVYYDGGTSTWRIG